MATYYAINYGQATYDVQVSTGTTPPTADLVVTLNDPPFTPGTGTGTSGDSIAGRADAIVLLKSIEDAIARHVWAGYGPTGV